MGKTAELRKAVKQIIESVCDLPCYYGQAQDDHPFDFVVYSVDEIMRTDGKIVYETEVNVSGYGHDTLSIEDISDRIQSAFDAHLSINDDIVVYFYAETKNVVQEEDRNVIRRRLTFSTNLYERK